MQVFSFGVVLFELLSREIMAAAILANARRTDSELCELFAYKVRAGCDPVSVSLCASQQPWQVLWRFGV